MGIKKWLGPKTEWNPAPSEKEITRRSRGSAFLVIVALVEVVFWTMLLVLPFSNYAVIDLLTLGMWAAIVWASYCAVVEISTMNAARDLVNWQRERAKRRSRWDRRERLDLTERLDLQEVYQKVNVHDIEA